MKSRLALVLHSHIPYVRGKGKWPFGEVWLYEAMAETYIPLLTALKRLVDEGVGVRLSFSFTPVLLEQLLHPDIKEGFIVYLEEKERLAEKDIRLYRARGKREIARLAEYYANFYREIKRDFEIEMDRDLVAYVGELKRLGVIEVLATAATHAYLPLIHDKKSLELQVGLGREVYEQCFGERPQGFWLPECGYSEGLDDVLEKNGFQYFFVDSHGLEGGKPVFASSFRETNPNVEEYYSASTGLTTYKAYRVKDKPLAVFGRNALISYQVWSQDYGYPGDPVYREFHRSSDESGLKYWRVTNRFGDLASKDIYDPVVAKRKALEHAEHFHKMLDRVADEAVGLGFEEPLLVACYDTELFGHWWWEGVFWLEQVLRMMDNSDCLMVLPQTCLEDFNRLDQATVLESSWGMGGKHWGWYNTETEWMWDTIREAIEQVNGIEANCGPILSEAYHLAWCELLLMQSSDWFFMVTGNQTRDYAVKRFFEHYARLTRICQALKSGDTGTDFLSWLNRVKQEDSIFIETLNQK